MGPWSCATYAPARLDHAVTDAGAGWARLGRLITFERGRRWRTRGDFARATGVSVRLLADLETGERSNYQPATLAAVEAALGWAPGTCEHVVAGGRIRREADPHLQRILDAWPNLDEDAKILLALLVVQLQEEKRGR